MADGDLIYTVAELCGGLLMDVQTFRNETAAQTYLEGIVGESEPDTVEDTWR